MDQRPLSPELIAEAAEWLVEIQDAPLDDEKELAFEQWKNQSPQHQRAWQQVQQLQSCLNDIPTKISKEILDDKHTHIIAGKFIILALLTSSVLTAGYFAHKDAWLADYRTGYGMQQTVILEDGSQVILNGKTAIDVDYTATARHIKLHYGEIFIQTAKDQPELHRPFKVLGKHGTIQALGTQFDVRQDQDYSRVAVLQHAVLIQTKYGPKHQLNADKQVIFFENKILTEQPADILDYAWRDGLIVANRISLEKMAEKIERQYGVTVEVEPQLKSLIISGTYPSTDLDALTHSLAQAYQLEIQQQSFPGKVLIRKTN